LISNRNAKIKRLAGFTIFELVTIVLVLGILSSLAIPRFLDLAEESRSAVLEGVSGAIAVTSAQVRAAAVLGGVRNGSVTVELLGVDRNVGIADGHPTAGWNSHWRYLLDLPGAPFPFTNWNTVCSGLVFCGFGNQATWPNDISANNAAIANLNGGRRALFIWFAGDRVREVRCYAYFVEADGNEPALTGVIDSEC
jgi:MSHA pilin protein MshA